MVQLQKCYLRSRRGRVRRLPCPPRVSTPDPGHAYNHASLIIGSTSLGTGMTASVGFELGPVSGSASVEVTASVTNEQNKGWVASNLFRRYLIPTGSFSATDTSESSDQITLKAPENSMCYLKVREMFLRAIYVATDDICLITVQRYHVHHKRGLRDPHHCCRRCLVYQGYLRQGRES